MTNDSVQGMTEYQKSVAKVIIDAVRRGNYIDDASRLAGMPSVCGAEWKQMGRDGKHADYVQFLIDIERAEADGVDKLIDYIQKAGEKSWQAASWLLERKYPAKFGAGRQPEQIATPLAKIEFVMVPGREMAQVEEVKAVEEITDGKKEDKPKPKRSTGIQLTT